MQKTIHWIKEHPLVIVLVIGAVVLFMLVFSGGGAPANSTASVNGPSDAAVNAAASLQAAQLQANLGMAQVSANLAGKESDNSTAIALGTIGANTSQYTADLQAALGIAGIHSQENIQLSGIQEQTMLADISRQSSRDQLNATVEIAALNAKTYSDITNAQANAEIARYQYTAAVQIAPYQAVSDLYTTLGSANLEKVITGAEATKGAVLQLPGINVGRVGSAGGNLFGNTIGNSSTANFIDSVMNGVSKVTSGYGFQSGLMSLGTF